MLTKSSIPLQLGLDYRQRGLSIIPLHSKGKKPLVEWAGYQARIATEKEILEWQAKWPEANVGIITGKISGIIALDVDAPDGIETIKRESLQMPPTLTSRTGGGGFHYIYKHPCRVVRNFSRKLPGLDLRGDGGYIVAPPSVHQSGNVYEWILQEPPVDAPEWLLNLVDQQDVGQAVSVNDWRSMTGSTVLEGERNQTVARLAGLLLRRHVDPLVVLNLLMAFNEARCRPPLSEKEILRTVDSIAGRELVRRQQRE